MDQEADQRRKLAIISPATMEQMLDKGNVWYVRHYEAYFDRVYVIYFVGSCHEPVTNGATTLLSLGTGRTKIDLLLAPYRLYRLFQEINPTTCLTADLVYSWWTCWLLKALLGAEICLMPVCMPEEIYRSSGRSLSGFLPIWVERRCISLSFAFADRVLAARYSGGYLDWLGAMRSIREKLLIVDKFAEDLPSKGFFENLRGHNLLRKGSTLVYVGRLHREKLVEDLVRMMAVIKRLGDPKNAMTLVIIGDGPERPNLEQLARNLSVEDCIRFVGRVRNEDLPNYLLSGFAFVSPLTGLSLIEAALCGLPIVAYEMDWVRGGLKHEETALLVPPGNFEEMARQVLRLVNDEGLRNRLSQNVRNLAWRNWSPEGLRESLHHAFGVQHVH